MTPTRENPDVFDDEFEVDEFDGFIADGFRPSAVVEGGHGRRSMSPEVRDQPVRTISAHYAPSPVSPISSRTPSVSSGRPRNSMRKSQGEANPFASPEDDERSPSLSFEPADIAHRSVSSASSRNFASTDSPRFGAGPSHPYNMYPQGTVMRSPSIATQSTIRAPPRPSSLQAEPQHPYSMYPQGVGEEEDEEDEPQAAAPVGFPGLGTSYHRRVGPDGEEQDIIGEDGHTEQLPPYTRYPEDGPEKMPLLVPSPPTALHSRAPVAGTDPTMALMHDPIRPPPTPQPQSMTDESALLTRSRSLGNVESNNLSEAEDSLLSNKGWKEKSWKEKRKTRVFGIPFWWILLSICVIIFIVAVLAGVIGGFFAHQRAEVNESLAAAETSLYDASAIPTPASGSPPTGTYQLSLSTPQETQAECLPNGNQQAAWSCNLAGQPAQQIVVDQPAISNVTGAAIIYGAQDDQICYGAQQSFMQTTWSPFITVTDNDAPGNGPAYYFQQFFDKVVVLPETALTVPNSGSKNKKRQGFQLDQGWLQQKSIAQPGEKPWFCVWNNTFLEGFIYVQQPIATSYILTTPTPAPTSNSSAASATSTSDPNHGSPTNFITSTLTMPSSTTTFTGPAAALAAWASRASQHQPEPSQSAYYDDDGDDGNNHSKRGEPAMYPYVVKLEERRLSGNTVEPYCQQYQILDDGGYNPTADDNNNPIIIDLKELDPPPSAYNNQGGSSRKLKERGLVTGGCHCQWTSGQPT